MNSPSRQYLPRISVNLNIHHYRDHSPEPSVPHPDPPQWGRQVPRGGERDPAVRDQHHQQQEEENPPPHRIRRLRGALQHDAPDASVRDGASK